MNGICIRGNTMLYGIKGATQSLFCDIGKRIKLLKSGFGIKHRYTPNIEINELILALVP